MEDKPMKTIYMVMRLDSSIRVYGEETPMPNGLFLIPGFENCEEAKHAACNGKFEIMEIEIPIVI